MLNTYQRYCYSILESLKEIGYSDESISKYKNVYDKFLNYIESKDLASKSLEEFCIEFLDVFYHINPYKNTTKYEKSKIRPLNLLVDYNRSNHFVYHRCFNNSPLLHKDSGIKVIDVIERFISLRKKEYNISKSTEAKYRNALYQFFEFLDSNKINELSNIKTETITDYVKFISTNTNSVMYSKLSTLRVFFRYCYDKGILNHDLSLEVPKGNRNRRVRLPSTLTQAQKETVLESIDRNDKNGCRNYAILLIASQLGLRASDIGNLTFSNIDWDNNLINITMQKIKKPITLPLTNEIGNAIIAYVKNHRPTSDLPNIFLTHIPPYVRLSPSRLSNIADQVINESGVKLKQEISSGMHIFRHTLASSLLEKGIDLPTVSSVLGHSSMKTTMTYLHIDVETLRECALEVPPFIWEGADFNE